MTTGEKIKKLLKENGLKQKDLILYVTGKETVESADKARWSRFLNDLHQIPYNDLTKVAKFLNVDVDYLISNEIPVTRYLPIIGEASCGVPTNHFYQDAEYEMYPVPEHLYKEGRYYVRAVGDSMLPKIKEGDIVLCDKEAYIDNGSIVHYTINGSESGIKKVICENNKPVMLQPLNPEYEPILIKDGDEVRMAKCLEVTSKL